MITVLRDRYVPSPDTADEVPADGAIAASLVDALERTWETDAHMCAYAPVTINGVTVRLASGALDELDAIGGAVRMTSCLGDIDAPNHVATPEWRAEVLPRLEASGLAYYETRGGYRVIGTLAAPFEIRSRLDAEAWRVAYLGWCEWLERTHGLVLDRRCADWTRLYRLPNVVREGVGPVRAPVHGTLAVVDPTPGGQWIEPPTSARVTERRSAIISTDTLERARIVLARMPASIAGQGGDECLLKAASAAAAEIGEDAAAIEKCLAEFNERAVPPWDAAKIKRESERAAERQASPEGRWARRLAERHASASFTPAAPDGTTLGRRHKFTDAEMPIEYLCKGLALATSDGKISLIAGEAGGGKGPIADYLALCFATGHKAFSVHECVRVPVLLLDCEGARLTMRRLRRMARAAGIDPLALDGSLYVIDASGALLVDDAYIATLRAYVAEHGIKVLVLDSYTSAMLATGIEANAPEFAVLARELGALGILVLCVAHTNKAASLRGGEPRLTDVAHSGAFGAMAQTAIVVRYPTPTDTHLIKVSCARAPEERFQAFCIRFANAEGDGLAVSVVVEAPALEKPIDKREQSRAAHDDFETRVLQAGRRIWAHLLLEPYQNQTALGKIAGQSKRAAPEAICRLVEAGLLHLVHKSYFPAPDAVDAPAARVDEALRGPTIGGFRRP